MSQGYPSFLLALACFTHSSLRLRVRTGRGLGKGLRKNSADTFWSGRSTSLG